MTSFAKIAIAALVGVATVVGASSARATPLTHLCEFKLLGQSMTETSPVVQEAEFRRHFAEATRLLPEGIYSLEKIKRDGKVVATSESATLIVQVVNNVPSETTPLRSKALIVSVYEGQSLVAQFDSRTGAADLVRLATDQQSVLMHSAQELLGYNEIHIFFDANENVAVIETSTKPDARIKTASHEATNFVYKFVEFSPLIAP